MLFFPFFSLESVTVIVYLHHNNHTMKEMITTLKEAYTENPKEFILNALGLVCLFAVFYGVLWLGSAIGLQ